MNIDHKSGRNRRSRSAGRAPRPNSAMVDKNIDRNKPERHKDRFGKLAVLFSLHSLVVFR